MGRFDNMHDANSAIFVAAGQPINANQGPVFWPRHWAWYVLLGLVVGLVIGHCSGTVVQLYIPEGEVAAELRKALLDV